MKVCYLCLFEDPNEKAKEGLAIYGDWGNGGKIEDLNIDWNFTIQCLNINFILVLTKDQKVDWWNTDEFELVSTPDNLEKVYVDIHTFIKI